IAATPKVLSFPFAIALTELGNLFAFAIETYHAMPRFLTYIQLTVAALHVHLPTASRETLDDLFGLAELLVGSPNTVAITGHRRAGHKDFFITGGDRVSP